MKIKIKLLLIIMIIACILVPYNTNFVSVKATDGESDQHFVVYTTDGQYLFERSDVEIDDSYITKNFEMYSIVSVDWDNMTATARFIKKLSKPDVTISENPTLVDTMDRKICLYMTHNDESYVPSDGYDSIYGAGGIHDVAKSLKRDFEKLGISVTLDETLHIPHDSNAYSRSSVTAKSLLNNYKPDALFDIHRDGVGRSYYATTVDGVEHSKIRIVVGKANPDMQENLDFALCLFSIAQSKYPWLFADIYYAKGHYNQALTNKALLFEMGTYLIEKDLVLSSTAPLADVVNTALYGSTINTENNEIVVGGESSEKTPTINDYFNDLQKDKEGKNRVFIIISSVSFGIITILIVLLIILNHRRKK